MFQPLTPLSVLFAALVWSVASPTATTQEPAPQTIAGVVTDPRGRPIDGAKIVATAVSTAAKPRTRSARTDADGQFEITALARGRHEVKVTAPGFQASVHASIATGTADLQVSLARIPGLIQGTVLDPDGKPVAEAWVNTLPNQDLEGSFGGFTPMVTDKTVKTDAQGRFRLDRLAPGTYRLKVRHPEFAHASVGGQVVRSSKVTGVGVISLVRGTEVSGEVRVGGQPGDRVKVTITSILNAAKPGSGFSSEAITDEQGRFVIDARVPPGSYQVMAARLSLPNPLLQIAEFHKTKTVIKLEPGQDELSLPITIEK